LQSSADNLYSDLLQKKPLIFSIGQGPAVRYALSFWVEKSETLASSISKKVPSEVSQLAHGLVSGSLKAFRRSADAFGDDDVSWKSIGSAHDQIKTAINVVRERAQELDRSIQSTNEKSRHLFDSLNTLNGAFVVATQRINTIGSIEQRHTAGILERTAQLQSTIESLINNLVAKKGFVLNSGHGSIVSFALQGYLYEIKSFSDAIASKFSQNPQDQSLASKNIYLTLERVLRKGVWEFETENGIY